MNNNNPQENLNSVPAFSYIGWVPCISGRLYFQSTACDKIGVGYINVNHVELDKKSNSEIRYLVIASNVNWKDIETHAEGSWNVVLLASAPAFSDTLEGKVYLIPAHNEIWDKTIKNAIKEVAELVKDKEDVRDQYKLLETSLDNGVFSANAFGSEFLLKDNGMTYLNMIPQGGKDHLEPTSFLICRQSYYYIKYSFHKDKHHARSESLTTIHRMPSNPEQVGLHLLNDLKKALVSLKRECDPSDYKSLFAAKGILSYCKSLAMSCKTEKYLSSDSYVAEKSYIDNMAESFEILGKRIEGELLIRAAFNINFRSIGLFIFAVLAPFTLLYKDEIRGVSSASTTGQTYSGTNHIVDVLKWFMKDEVHVLYVTVGVLVIYFVLKKIHLRYGSPNLAIKRFSGITKKTFNYVLDNERDADLILKFAYVVVTFLVIFWVLNTFPI